MKLVNIVAFCGFLAFISSDAAIAQRDPPVWSSYLSPIAIADKHPVISTQFMFHKNGGPHEHFKHQCFILLYLKSDEQEILKTVADKALINKKTPLEKSFLAHLKRTGKVVQLDSKVAKRVQDEMREECQCSSGYCFPFEFEFEVNTLFERVKQLKSFDVNDVIVAGNSTWFNQKFGLIAFIPVNDSLYSKDVDVELQQTPDFANVMDWDTSILYFKPLPYDFSFKRHKRIEEKMLVYIN